MSTGSLLNKLREALPKALRNYDLLAGLLLFVAIAISKANTIALPYYWDEYVYISPANWLYNGSLMRAFPGLHPPTIFFGHPFALYVALALVWKVFTESIIVSHIFILCISFLGVYYTYLLGIQLHNRTVGFIAALLLLFSPLYFAQSGMVNGDVAITSLSVITIYYFLRRRYIPYLVSGILLVLTKESAIACIAALLLYLYFEERKRPSVSRELAKYSVPLIIILVFFLAQKLTTGMFLPNQYFDSHPFFESSFGAFLHKFGTVFKWA